MFNKFFSNCRYMPQLRRLRRIFLASILIRSDCVLRFYIYVQLDGCIVSNAHNTVLGEEVLLIYIVCKFREIWLTGNRQSRALFTLQKKTKKFPQALLLSILRGLCPKSVRSSPKQYTRSSPNFIQIRSLPAEHRVKA